MERNIYKGIEFDFDNLSSSSDVKCACLEHKSIQAITAQPQRYVLMA